MLETTSLPYSSYSWPTAATLPPLALTPTYIASSDLLPVPVENKTDRLSRQLTDSLIEEKQALHGSVTATDFRHILANPTLRTSEFALRLVREFKVQETLQGDPDLYYLKKDIAKILKEEWARKREEKYALIKKRQNQGELTSKEAKAHKILADEELRKQYEPLLSSFKDPNISAFTLVTLSTFVPYLIMDPFAKWAGAHLSQALSFLPGVYAPGTLLSGGATALLPPSTAAEWFAASAFSDPYLLGAYVLGNVATALTITGLYDTFKFSPLIMSGLDYADKFSNGGILSRWSRSLKTFFAKPKEKNLSTSKQVINHGIIGYESSLLSDKSPAPKWLLSARNFLSSSRFRFVKSIGEALPATRGEWKMYKTDVAALNAPVIALFSGLLPVSADLTHQFIDPSYAAVYGPMDILTRGAMAISAGLLAWSIGCIGNTRIMNHHKNYSPPEAANNLATRDRQIYSIMAYAPIMAFLIQNFNMGWQQGMQVLSAATLLAGVSVFYSQKESNKKKNA